MDLEYSSQIKKIIKENDPYSQYKSVINGYFTENPDSTYSEIRQKSPPKNLVICINMKNTGSK